MKYLSALIIIILLFIETKGQDTFSITAIDTITGEVGSAGASCIDESAIPGGCFILSDVKPGIGVIHTQAYWHPDNQDYASSLMDIGIAPQDIIDSLVANDIQNNPHIRQYGVIDLFDGTIRRAAYTGSNCDDYKNHILGANYTIQGNILLGQEILDSMEQRFLATEGELACKLMAALQGAKVIGADTRCFDDGTSSLSAFLRVGQTMDLPDDLYLDLNVPSTPTGVDPIDSLQTLVDQWGGCIPSDIGHQGHSIVVIAHPNPARNYVIFKSMVGPFRDGQLFIHDSQGLRIIEDKGFNGMEHKLNIRLNPGLYFYQISDKNGIDWNGKLLIR